MRAYAQGAWVVTLFGLLASGCGGDSPCGRREPASNGGAPRIRDVEVVADALPDDPWYVVFLLDFRDADGDLGKGRASVFLNANEATSLSLFDIFRQSALAEDATGGMISLPVRFADNVPDDSDVTVGLMLEDEDGYDSNCYSVDLRFNVESGP